MIDTVDSNLIDQTVESDNKQNTRSVNNNYNTIVKRKGIHSSRNPIRIEDNNLSTIESVDITDLSKSKEIDQTSLENDQQYEDITDVQVIAKMQEESKPHNNFIYIYNRSIFNKLYCYFFVLKALRQSVLNINKGELFFLNLFLYLKKINIINLIYS